MKYKASLSNMKYKASLSNIKYKASLSAMKQWPYKRDSLHSRG
jgi:hypothetical protein